MRIDRGVSAEVRSAAPSLTLAAADSWLFDLDNTLYPVACGLSQQVHARQALFMQTLLGVHLRAAHEWRRRYAEEYGTALCGLMRLHAVRPADYFAFVHEVDYSVVAPNPLLDAALATLPGQKLVFTNGSYAHADKVLERLGVAHRFTDIFDLSAAGFSAKPDRAAYARLVARHGVHPERTVFCDDTLRNLPPARALGMSAVWLSGPGAPAEPVPADVHRIYDLIGWITGLPRSEAGRAAASC